MLRKDLDARIHDASLRSQQNLEQAKAEKKIRALPWLSTEQALPQNDFGVPAKTRKKYLVRIMPCKRMAIAHFGYERHDWWIDTSGKLLTPYFGHTVVGWCPLPDDLGEDTCEETSLPSPAH